MSIACVAIVGKECDPLYLRTFTSSNPSSSSSPSSLPFAATSIDPAASGPLRWNTEEGIKFHYFVHTSIDVIEEKTNKSKKSSGVSLPGDLYLGLLLAVDEYRVFGYITNTKVKLLVIVQECSQEVNLKPFLRDLHTLYTATVCNPFSDIGAAIQNPTFELNIQKMVQSWFYVERK